MPKDFNNVTMIVFNDFTDCFLSISAEPDKRKGNGIKNTMCFCYSKNGKMVEWEPENGAIVLIQQVENNDPRLKDPKFVSTVKPHWLFGEAITDWTQTNVIGQGLPEAYVKQDFEKIFKVLMSYI